MGNTGMERGKGLSPGALESLHSRAQRRVCRDRSPRMPQNGASPQKAARDSPEVHHSIITLRFQLMGFT